MDKKNVRHIDTMDGLGQLIVGNSNYRVSYRIEVYQEFIGDLASFKDIQGNLRLLEDKAPNSFNNEEAILILSDDRKIGINLPPFLVPLKDFNFSLRDVMDLKE